MHLKGLAGGGPQGAIAEPIGQFIDGQIQLGGDAAAGAAQPQHHLPVLVLALLAIVAVVLLITAVELEDLNGVFAEVGPLVGQFAEQGLQQVAAMGLELLQLALGRSADGSRSPVARLGGGAATRGSRTGHAVDGDCGIRRPCCGHAGFGHACFSHCCGVDCTIAEASEQAEASERTSIQSAYPALAV